MKLIVRIDDIGYTDINNMGSFLAIHEGIATAADVMLDTPGTEDALRRLKECPWISVGWHTHFWGSPVLPAEQVPSLIQENGHFKPDMYKQPVKGAGGHKISRLCHLGAAGMVRCASESSGINSLPIILVIKFLTIPYLSHTSLMAFLKILLPLIVAAYAGILPRIF